MFSVLPNGFLTKRGTASSLPKARYKYQNKDKIIVQVYVFSTALLARKGVQCHTCVIVYKISCWVGEGTVRNSTASPTDRFQISHDFYKFE